MSVIHTFVKKSQKILRKITEKEVKSAIGNPDMLVDTIKGKKMLLKS